MKILPYAGVLVTALLGWNVLVVLTGGTILSGIIGFLDGSYTLASFFKSLCNRDEWNDGTRTIGNFNWWNG